MRHVMGIDLGTSSLKAVLLREDGTVAATAAHAYPIAVPRPGWAEQSPDDWWQAARAAIATLLHGDSAGADTISAIAVGGQMHGTVLLDRTGVPLRPAVIWPDQRTVAEAHSAEQALDARGLLERLGGGVAAGFMLATLLWCRAHEPTLWRHAALALLPKDYLRYRFTGVAAAEPSDGSGIPLVDLRSREWCRPALAALDLPAQLFPPLVTSTSVAGTVTSDVAAATGLRAGTPVYAGGSDQALAALGAGVVSPGTLLLSISTGGQLVTPLLHPLPAPVRGLHTLCHALPDTYLALSATLGAGLSLRWLREVVFDDRADGSEARLMDLAAAAPPGAGGLLFLPYLSGERAPLLDAEASGAFVGLRLDHGRPHLARAVLEGVAFSLRHAYEPLQAAGVRATRLVLAGGAARSPLIRAIVADVLAQEVTPLQITDQSALGAALLAAAGVGFFPDLLAACAAVVRYEPPVTPDPARVALYRALYERYHGLYPKLRDDAHALRRFG